MMNIMDIINRKYGKNRKAQTNMWWVILGAVLVIVIVAVLLIIFGKGADKGQSGFFGCLGKGGTCTSLEECTSGGGTPSEAFECPKDTSGQDQICCFKEKAFA